MRLHDLQQQWIIEASQGWRGSTLEEFARIPEIRALGWPQGVIQEWLWPFIDRPEFLQDYGHIDLTAIDWHIESLPTRAYLAMTTGASEAGLLEDNARNHVRWVAVRPQAVQDGWELAGTWDVPPIILSRALVDAAKPGYQVVEGRTRVGILMGRVRDSLRVAPNHVAWVGHPHRGRV